MIIIPKSHPRPFYFTHPGTMLRRSWISPPPTVHTVPNRWVLSLYPVRQPMKRLPTAPPAAAAPNTPAMNRVWFHRYQASHVAGQMRDGQPPNDGQPIDVAEWQNANTLWNLVGGYGGHSYHSGQQLFMHLNMLGPPYGGPNWVIPPFPGITITITACTVSAPGIGVVVTDHAVTFHPGNIVAYDVTSGQILRATASGTANHIPVSDAPSAALAPGDVVMYYGTGTTSPLINAGTVTAT